MDEAATISLCDPVLGEKEKEALCSVIDSRWISMGGQVRDFERAFAKLHGTNDAVAVSSCTAGLHLCLRALNIGAGDEVMVPSLTFVASANAIVYVGAKPVFVDIENIELPHMSLADAKTKRTDKTKAIIVMHYGGYVVDLAKWRAFAEENGMLLVEDAAHAPGTDGVGTWGDASSFSFFSNKNMTTAEGGMVLARDPRILEKVRQMRSHGMTTGTLERYRGHSFSYDVTELGYNYRMDELRAALGLVQLKSLFERNNYRRQLINLYRDSLEESVPEVSIPFRPNQQTAGHLMAVLLPFGVDRDRVMKELRGAGIQSSIHYPPVHQFSYYRKQFPDHSLPNTEQFCARELTLPLHPGLDSGDVLRVVDELRGVIAETSLDP